MTCPCKAAYEAAAKVLSGMGDSAYCRGDELSKRDLCLGEEHKLTTHTFTLDNLKALETVRGKFGEATGLWDGAKAIRALPLCGRCESEPKAATHPSTANSFAAPSHEGVGQGDAASAAPTPGSANQFWCEKCGGMWGDHSTERHDVLAGLGYPMSGSRNKRNG